MLSLSARGNRKKGTESSSKQNLEAWRGEGHGDSPSMAGHCVFWGWAALPGCRSLAHPRWILWSCRKQLRLGIKQEDVFEAKPGVKQDSGNASGASSLPVQNPSPAGCRVPRENGSRLQTQDLHSRQGICFDSLLSLEQLPRLSHKWGDPSSARILVCGALSQPLDVSGACGIGFLPVNPFGTGAGSRGAATNLVGTIPKILPRGAQSLGL